MRKTLVSLVALAAGLLVAGVTAAPTPLSPATGSVVTALRPSFHWQLPSSEVSESIGVAKAPDTGPTGEFLTQNVVGLDAVDPDATSHTFDQPFAAGTYWWHVTSHDTTGQQTGHLFSPAIRFTIRATITKPSVAIRFAGRSFLATVQWQANVGTLVVKGRLLAGKRLLSSHQDRSAGILGQPGQDISTWTIPGTVKRGTTLRFLVTLSAPGTTVSTTISKTFRAP